MISSSVEKQAQSNLGSERVSALGHKAQMDQGVADSSKKEEVIWVFREHHNNRHASSPTNGGHLLIYILADIKGEKDG